MDIINNHLMLSAMRMVIQDNFILQQYDSKHTARLIQEYMSEMGLQVLEWPSYSPDLNPIEHASDQQEAGTSEYETQYEYL